MHSSKMRKLAFDMASGKNFTVVIVEKVDRYNITCMNFDKKFNA